MVKPELKSAEAVTKFLRAKNGSFQEIIETAHNLLESTFDIYLPNQAVFILELLCDRLNDFNSQAFKGWKFQAESWMLLKSVWNALGTDEAGKAKRHRIIHRIRFIEILVTIFGGGDADVDESFMDTIIDVVNVIKQDFYIEAEESLLIELLYKFTIRLSKLSNDNPNQTLAWTIAVKDVYNSPKKSSSYVPTRKSYNKFIQECLPSILNYLTVCNFPQVRVEFEDIVKKSIFNSSFKTDLVKSIKPLLSSSNPLPPASITAFFKLTVENTSNRDFVLCEGLFAAIVEVEHYKQLTEQLLSIIESVNKTVSNSFVKSIYNEAVGSDTFINWKLIVHLLRLDIELALENAHFISLQMKSMKDTTIVNDIGSSLLNAHVKGRDLSKFIIEVWPAMIRSNSFYSSDGFVSEVSESINDLSASQLISLVIKLCDIEDREESQPLLTAVIKGLLSVSVAKQEQVKETILSQVDIIYTDSPGYWQMRYYLLCIYSLDFHIDVKKFKKKSNKFYFHFLFRLVEVSRDFSLINEEEDQLLQIIKNDKESIQLCLERWLIVIEASFSHSQMQDFINIVFQGLDLSEVKTCLQVNGEFISERTKFVSSLIQYLNKQVKANPHFASIIQHIPLQTIDRRPRITLIDNIYDVIVASKPITGVEGHFMTLRHLLSQPSYSSQLEKEPNCIFRLLAVDGADKNQSVVAVIKSIWIHHLNQQTSEDSKRYVTQMLNNLNGHFSTKKAKRDLSIPQYEVAYLILSNSQGKKIDEVTVQLLQTLKLNVLNSSSSRITAILNSKKIDLDNINWLLRSFLLINDNDDVDYLGLLKGIGEKVSTSDHSSVLNDIRRVCFSLMASKLADEGISGSYYVLALFVSLTSEYSMDLSTEISEYIQEITQGHPETLITLFEYVLHSTEQADETYIGACVALLGSLITSLNKDTAPSHQLFISSVGTVLSKIEIISLSSTTSFLSVVREVLGDKVWLFNQSSLELTITFIDKCGYVASVSTSESSLDLYILATQAFSHILLYHRYKLTSRHHIILASCSRFLESLSKKRKDSLLPTSKLAGRSYSRLLENLCEPSKTSLSIKDKTNLTSSSVLVKRALRKHLPILLVNYIFFSLKYNFESSMNDEIISGIYSAFDVLSQEEIRLISSSMDIPGKTFLRSLYANYKENGKWKDV